MFFYWHKILPQLKWAGKIWFICFSFCPVVLIGSLLYTADVYSNGGNEVLAVWLMFLALLFVILLVVINLIWPSIMDSKK